MPADYRRRLEQYISTMLPVKQWRDAGFISPEEYAEIDTMIASKYGLSSCNIYRGIDLLYDEVRGIMQCEEAI